ncbi:MAG: site-specific integrase [Aquificota bacterium]|nr:site-specific integrase [Aquificota bacterium]
MEHLIDLYLNELKKIRDPKTIETKEYALKHLIDYTDELIDLDRGELLSFYEHLKEKGLKESSIRAILREARQFYRWLRQRGYSVEFDSEALEDIYRAKRKQERKGKGKKYYSDEELETILSAIRGALEGFEPKHPIYYLLTIFLVSSGLRLSEALSMKKKNIRVKKVLTSEGEEKEIWMAEVREGKFGKEREALIYFFRPSGRPCGRSGSLSYNPMTTSSPTPSDIPKALRRSFLSRIRQRGSSGI